MVCHTPSSCGARAEPHRRVRSQSMGSSTSSNSIRFRRRPRRMSALTSRSSRLRSACLEKMIKGLLLLGGPCHGDRNECHRQADCTVRSTSTQCGQDSRPQSHGRPLRGWVRQRRCDQSSARCASWVLEGRVREARLAEVEHCPVQGCGWRSQRVKVFTVRYTEYCTGSIRWSGAQVVSKASIASMREHGRPALTACHTSYRRSRRVS